jgi:lysophospholipase L1-like esterase
MRTRRQALGGILALPAMSAAAAAPAPGGLRLRKGQKLVMIGDSITDMGRARPVGEGRGNALGQGYPMVVDAMLGAFHPEMAIRVVNMGASGNTVRDLRARWRADVTDLKPDWVSIMIGANDVWRQFDSPRQKEKHVLVDEYERTLDELVAETASAVTGIVLLTPFYIEPNRQDAMRVTMDKYGAVVRKLASKHNAVLVDTQAAFDVLLKHVYPATINWDRVHPNHIGHMALARALLTALGFRWV